MSNQLHTSADAVRFAVEFAQADLEKTNAQALAKQICHFFQGAYRPGAPAPDRHELLKVQADTRAFLERLMHEGFASESVRLLLCVYRHGSARRTRQKSVASSATASLRDRFLFRLIELLNAQGAEKLRVCAAPGCGRVFFKVTRKEFCSARCQSRINVRRWRADNKGR
jgi:hypothetical protein